jgi:hypothetical protein
VTPFHERAEQMGFDVSFGHRGMFIHRDRYSEVVYRQLQTGMMPHHDSNIPHPTDGVLVPKLGIFTKGPDWVDYRYAGYVSQMYRFIGNDVLNQRIRDAISSVGMPIITENTIMNDLLTRMRNEIIIQSSQNIPNAGDVLPVMVINNSYDGSRAATIAFGIAMNYNNNRVVFAFNLGEMRQVHIESSTTSMSSAVNSYMGVFTESIVDMITQSFESRLTEDEMLAVLDVVEGFGRKRREAVSALLDEITPESGLPTSWQVFLAIVRYSSFEPNLNIKRLMENAAESVLVIPPRMYEVLERL